MKIPSLLFDPTILIEALLAPTGDSARLLRRCLESDEELDLCSTEAALLLLRRTAAKEELQRFAGLSRVEIERWITALELRLTLLEASTEKLSRVAEVVGSSWQQWSEVDRQSLAVAASEGCLLVTRESQIRTLVADATNSEQLKAVETAEPQVVLDLLDALGV